MNYRGDFCRRRNIFLSSPWRRQHPPKPICYRGGIKKNLFCIGNVYFCPQQQCKQCVNIGPFKCSCISDEGIRLKLQPRCMITCRSWNNWLIDRLGIDWFLTRYIYWWWWDIHILYVYPLDIYIYYMNIHIIYVYTYIICMYIVLKGGNVLLRMGLLL